MEETLRAALLAALDAAGGRVDWGLRPQADALPAVTLSLISRVRDQTLAGRSGLVMSRVQLDAWGDSYLAAKLLARAAVAATDSLSPAPGPFKGVFVDAERDGDPEEGADAPIHRTSLDLIVWHPEP